MALNPDFETISEADSTYFGSEDTQDDDNDGSPDPTGWGEPQDVPTDWRGGWSLVKQARVEDASRTRYIVVRATQSGSEALTEGGTAKTVSLEFPLSDRVPTFDTEADATAAYEAWLEENDPEETPDEGGNANWGDWSKVTEVPPWWVWGREHQDGEQTQLLAAGMLDGNAVYLQADGSVGQEAHIFTTTGGLQAALDAYATKVENGDIPEGEQPTGNSPSSDTVNSAGNAAGSRRGGGGASGGVLSTLTSPMGMVAVVVVAGALYYAYQEGYLDDFTGGTQA